MNPMIAAKYGKLTKPDGTVIINNGGTITTILLDGTSTTEPQIAKPKEETKPKEEAKPKKVKMKKWSDNPTALVQYQNLIKPLKQILDTGYRLFRKDVQHFDYDGYNIGKNELAIFPSPKNQLSGKFLEKNTQRGNNLIDIVLNIAFLLGMEQGRRAERKDQVSTETLIATLESYRESNKNLRYRIDELTAFLSAKEQHPFLSNDDLSPYVQLELLATKDKRMQEIKKEIQQDQTRSSFSFAARSKPSFNELRSIIETLPGCSKSEWTIILKDHSWTFDEWDAKCSKKKLVFKWKQV